MGYTVISREFIFEEERPFRSCHASTLAVLPSGEVVAAWFGGSREGADDVAIWISRRTDPGWTAPVKTADCEGIPHWNPVLFSAPEGPLCLFYKAGKKIAEWETMLAISEDGGKSWSRPQPLVPGDRGGRGPVKNKPIVLQDGTWAAPASVEGEFWDAFADLSNDQGATWTMSAKVPIRHKRKAIATAPAVKDAVESTGALDVPPVPAASFAGKGVIQPTLWESAPGKVHMLLRSTAGHIYRSDSDDSGKTWSPAYATGLPNNNSGIDLAQMENGILALIYNPVDANWGARTPLVMELSGDNGATWGKRLILENEPGEYSYPSVVSRGNELFLTYTWKRERIVFWHITVGEENLP